MCDLQGKSILAHSEWHPNQHPQSTVLKVTSTRQASATFFRVTLKRNKEKTITYKIGPGASCTLTFVGTDVDTMHLW
jgi:hypothetical protein